MKYESGPPPIAMVGSGHPGHAALVNKLVDIAYNAEEGAGPVQVAVFDSRDVPRPHEEALYPLGERPAGSLHPFYTTAPAPGFPTFGEYFDEETAKEMGVPKSRLLAPTWLLVRDYLEYLLELAVGAAGEKLLIVEVPNVPIREIRETMPNGPATIVLTDGSCHEVRCVVRPRHPPHLAGPRPGSPEPTLASETRQALAGSKLTFEEGRNGSYFLFDAMGRNAAVTHEAGEPNLVARIEALLPAIQRLVPGELWVVTWKPVDSAIKSSFQDRPVRLLSLEEFRGMMDLMKQLDVGEKFRKG